MATTNKLNGAQVIVDYLIQEKVPQVFGLCGHGNIQFIDALYERSADIKTISVHHESVAGFMADVYYRVSGKATATFTSCGPGSAQLPVSLATAYLELGAVPGRDRQRADQPVQPRRLPGDVPAEPGRLPVDRAQPVQAGVPADARRDGAARGTAGLEDDDDGAPRAGGAGRPVRCVHGIGRRRSAERQGMERQHLEPLWCRSRRRRESRRHAARRRAPCHFCRASHPPRRRGRGIAQACRTLADSGGGFDERARRDRHPPSARAGSGRAWRPLSGQPRHASGRRVVVPRYAVR